MLEDDLAAARLRWGKKGWIVGRVVPGAPVEERTRLGVSLRKTVDIHLQKIRNKP